MATVVTAGAARTAHVAVGGQHSDKKDARSSSKTTTAGLTSSSSEKSDQEDGATSASSTSALRIRPLADYVLRTFAQGCKNSSSNQFAVTASTATQVQHILTSQELFCPESDLGLSAVRAAMQKIIAGTENEDELPTAFTHTMFSHENVTVSLWSVPPGKSIPLHGHPAFVVGRLVSGEMESTSYRPTTLAAGGCRGLSAASTTSFCGSFAGSSCRDEQEHGETYEPRVEQAALQSQAARASPSSSAPAPAAVVNNSEVVPSSSFSFSPAFSEVGGKAVPFFARRRKYTASEDGEGRDRCVFMVTPDENIHTLRNPSDTQAATFVEVTFPSYQNYACQYFEETGADKDLKMCREENADEAPAANFGATASTSDHVDDVGFGDETEIVYLKQVASPDENFRTADMPYFGNMRFLPH
eukprot:CAMPEP_0178993160 /NCGR_PEP_ID=MMETSP0795-20121207/6547_1 /TAXON_ID=88552 /ORGANISM="Amoebophrya sp., Strain Ameob2" /LENGTH=414 /DNA_ID=CAMNT_0020685185 /DNA_START=487 /DNA_END=1731 /DNA_ORIENTATION=+